MLPSVVEATVALEDDHWWFVARRAIVASLVRDCVPPDEGRVLVDVGCGAGGNLAELAGAYECYGVDPDPVMIDAAQARASPARFVQGRVPEDLPDGATPADACLVMDVLEHVEDDRRLLADVLGLCRAGGYTLLTVPAGPSLWSRHDEVHGHYRRYTVPSLERLVSGAAEEASRSVEVRLLSPYCSRLYPFVWGLRRLQGLLGGAESERRDGESGDLSLPPRPVNGLLTRLFAGEAGALRRALGDEGSTRAFRRGSSLIAVLRLGDGPETPA